MFPHLYKKCSNVILFPKQQIADKISLSCQVCQCTLNFKYAWSSFGCHKARRNTGSGLKKHKNKKKSNIKFCLKFGFSFMCKKKINRQVKYTRCTLFPLIVLRFLVFMLISHPYKYEKCM